jgi:AcrR family transcriptional regulator
MNKKEIRQQRVRNYFIEATCEIIRQEGIKGLNIRKVADLAGYHYASIYKYFEDFPHLIANSVLQFLEEASRFIDDNASSEDPIEYYVNAWGAFCRYCLDNPNIFGSIFTENYGDIKTEEIEAIFEASSLFKQRRKSVLQVSKALGITPEAAKKFDNISNALCIGSIVLYISHRTDFSIDEVIQNNIESIRLLVDSYKRED